MSELANDIQKIIFSYTDPEKQRSDILVFLLEKDVINKNRISNFSWWRISQYAELTEDFIWKYQDYVDWSSIFWYQKINEKFIKKCLENEKIKDNINWTAIFLKKELNEKNMEKYICEVDWNRVREALYDGEPCNDEIIYTRIEIYKKYPDKFCWNSISQYDYLDVEFVNEFKNKLDWDVVSKRSKWDFDNNDVKIEENVYIKFEDYFDLEYASKYHKLSENVIRKLHGWVQWEYISKYQKLSIEFIEEFSDYIDWVKLYYGNKNNTELVKKFHKEIINGFCYKYYDESDSDSEYEK